MKNKPSFMTPEMPEYIKIDSGIKNGVLANIGLHVSDLSEDEAIEFAELMKETFIKHWETHLHILKNI